MEPFSLVVVAVAALLVVGLSAWRRQARHARRRAHPKDYAFRVAFGWGPEMKLPKIERLKKHLPWIQEQSLVSWLPELEQAERSLAPLVEAGGPKVLGEAEVERRIKELNPFLIAEGLRHAMFLVSYGAMQDGYDKQPLRRSEKGRLTLRSSGGATAWHLAREALWFIIRLSGQAPYRRSPLSSNVSRHGGGLSRLLRLAVRDAPPLLVLPSRLSPATRWRQSSHLQGI